MDKYAGLLIGGVLGLWQGLTSPKDWRTFHEYVGERTEFPLYAVVFFIGFGIAVLFVKDRFDFGPKWFQFGIMALAIVGGVSGLISGFIADLPSVAVSMWFPMACFGVAMLRNVGLNTDESDT